MFLITLEQVLSRTGFTKDELSDLIRKELFPYPFIIRPIEKWNIDGVEKFCIFNNIKPKEKAWEQRH